MTPNKRSPTQNPLLLAAGLASLFSGLLVWMRRRVWQSAYVQPQLGRLRGRALITGASSGIGEAFSRHLAARGYDLTIVARREVRLQALAAELHSRYGTDVQVLPADLSVGVEVERLAAHIENAEPLEILINNAGFATHGKFSDVPVDRELDMVAVHLGATVRLTRAALPGMLATGRGGIINVSSIASFLPIPGSAMYSATKSFLNIFSETLQMELGQQGIYVQSLCPGFTHTGFHSTEDQKDAPVRSYPEFMWSDSSFVVETSLNALGNGQVIVIPGRINQAIAAFARSLLIRPIVKLVLRRLFLRRRTPSGPLARAR